MSGRDYNVSRVAKSVAVAHLNARRVFANGPSRVSDAGCAGRSESDVIGWFLANIARRNQRAEQIRRACAVSCTAADGNISRNCFGFQTSGEQSHRVTFARSHFLDDELIDADGNIEP